MLGLGVLAVIGNTIRLEIQQRRPEIEVTKLVGGSNAFVRRPFLYTGVFYGLGGALLAALIISAASPGSTRRSGSFPPSTAANSIWRAWGVEGWGSSSAPGPVSAGSGALIRPAGISGDRAPRLSRYLLEQ